MTTDSAPTPEGESSVPDEEWELFLADNERDIRASAPKEPSARARIVARRLREQEEQRAAAAGRRRGRRERGAPFARTGHDTAWRSGRTDEPDRRVERRGRARGFVAVVLLVAVLLIVLSPGHAWSLVTGGH